MKPWHIEWARQHNWFLYAFESVDFPGTYSIVVEGGMVNADGSNAVERLCFDDIGSLRDWAGY